MFFSEFSIIDGKICGQINAHGEDEWGAFQMNGTIDKSSGNVTITKKRPEGGESRYKGTYSTIDGIEAIQGKVSVEGFDDKPFELWRGRWEMWRALFEFDIGTYKLAEVMMTVREDFFIGASIINEFPFVLYGEMKEGTEKGMMVVDITKRRGPAIKQNSSIYSHVNLESGILKGTCTDAFDLKMKRVRIGEDKPIGEVEEYSIDWYF